MNRLQQWIARAGSRPWSNWPARAYLLRGYQQRLAAVQRHVRECLDLAPTGALRVVSLCAGDGRDVMSAIGPHPRRDDVSAWLVEADGNSVEDGIRRAKQAGLDDEVRFLHADATSYATYLSITPADVLLVCGVWGHVPPEDRASVVAACRALCRRGGTVVWTRGVGRGQGRFEEIRSLFLSPQWDEVRTTITADAKWAVATFRSMTPADPPPACGRFFQFRTASG